MVVYPCSSCVRSGLWKPQGSSPSSPHLVGHVKTAVASAWVERVGGKMVTSVWDRDPRVKRVAVGHLTPLFFFNPLCLEHFLELNKFLVLNLIYSCLETRVGVLMCLIQFYSKSIRSRYSSGVCAQEVCACVECACNHTQASNFLNANLRVCLGIYRLPIILLSPLMERCKYPYKSSSLLWRLCWQTSKQFLCRVWFSTLGIEPLRVELSGLVRNV